jgi:MFS family permease
VARAVRPFQRIVTSKGFSMSTQTLSVFSNRSFRLFYAGQTFSYVGDGLRLIAIPLLVYHLTGTALSVGWTYALELGPFALFGLVGGSLADRLDRRSLMIGADVVRFAVLALFGLGYAFGFLSLGLLYAGIVTISLAAAVFMGGQASSIPFLLGKERATRATSVLMAAEQTTLTILPPIGGAFFALVGPLPALAINALTYLISQGSLALVPTLGPHAPSGLPTYREVRADIATGFRFMWGDRAMRAISAASFCLNFFGLMAGAVLIPFLKRDFGASDLVVGYALGCGAIGAVAGSWFAGRVPASWPFGRLLLVAYALDGVLFVPVMFTHHLVIAIGFLSLTNGCALFEIAQIVGWRMRITPAELVGRVFGAVRLVALGGTVPGALAGGLIADRYGARAAMIVAGLGYLGMALAVAAVPAIRRERR